MWGDRWGFDPVAEINESSTYEAASRDARSRDLVPVCLSSLTPLRPFEPRRRLVARYNWAEPGPSKRETVTHPVTHGRLRCSSVRKRANSGAISRGEMAEWSMAVVLKASMRFLQNSRFSA